MRKLSATALVSVALVIGLGGGFYVGMRTARHFSEPTERSLRVAAASREGDAVLRALRHLRTGSTNAVPFLELHLDQAVIEVGDALSKMPKAEAPQAEIHFLAHVRDYRLQFPHTPEVAGWDHRIAQAFALVDEHH